MDSNSRIYERCFTDSNIMKKVYLVFHWVNYSDWDDFDQYDYIEIEKAFQRIKKRY